MTKIKIYTGEEIRKRLNSPMDDEVTIDEFIESLTPIELPSDEEIEEYVKSTGYYGHCTHEYHEGIEEGAKWMRDRLQGGNK